MPRTRMAALAADGSVPIRGPESALILAARTRGDGAAAGASAPAASSAEEEDQNLPDDAGGSSNGGHLAAGHDTGRADPPPAGVADRQAPLPGTQEHAVELGGCTQEHCGAPFTPQETGSGCACSRGREDGSSSSTSQGAELHPQAAMDMLCSSRGTCGPDQQGEEQLERLEARHVHSVYDIIASHFSATRFAIWPKVTPYFYRCLLIPLHWLDMAHEIPHEVIRVPKGRGILTWRGYCPGQGVPRGAAARRAGGGRGLRQRQVLWRAARPGGPGLRPQPKPGGGRRQPVRPLNHFTGAPCDAQH